MTSDICMYWLILCMLWLHMALFSCKLQIILYNYETYWKKKKKIWLKNSVRGVDNRLLSLYGWGYAKFVWTHLIVALQYVIGSGTVVFRPTPVTARMICSISGVNTIWGLQAELGGGYKAYTDFWFPSIVSHKLNSSTVIFTANVSSRLTNHVN